MQFSKEKKKKTNPQKTKTIHLPEAPVSGIFSSCLLSGLQPPFSSASSSPHQAGCPYKGVPRGMAEISIKSAQRRGNNFSVQLWYLGLKSHEDKVICLDHFSWKLKWNGCMHLPKYKTNLEARQLIWVLNIKAY